MTNQSDFTLVFGKFRLPLDIQTLAGETLEGTTDGHMEFRFRFAFRRLSWSACCRGATSAKALGSGAGTCSSALHLGHVTTAPALPGAAASSWLQR